MKRIDIKSLASKSFREFHKKQGSHNFKFATETYDRSDSAEKADAKYCDWVVTCCFYSALHFIQAELIRRKNIKFFKDSIEFLTLEDLYKECKRKKCALPKDFEPSRHQLLKRLAKDNLSSRISNSYSNLFDKAHTSRYKHFPWDDFETANSALVKCKEIESWFEEILKAEAVPRKKK